MAIDAAWRLQWKLNPGTGLPGYTTLYFDATPAQDVPAAQAAADAGNAFMRAAFGGGIGPWLPTGVALTDPVVADAINLHTGDLVASVAVTAAAAFSGSSSGSYAAGVGACATWTTAGFLNGHRVRGRTFIVPLGSAGLDNQGTLATATQTGIQTAGTTMINAAADLIVWHRPSGPGASDGAGFSVIGCKVTDRAAQLRSRRQ